MSVHAWPGTSKSGSDLKRQIFQVRAKGINNEQKDVIICQLKTTFAQGKVVTHDLFPESSAKFRWNAAPP
jgi:hypothetical protein